VTVSSLAAATKADPDGVMQHLARSARFDRDALAALNTAFLQDGAFVSLDEGVVLDLPIHIIYLSSLRTQPFFSSPRNLIVAGAGAKVSLVETYAGLRENIYFTNAVSEIILGREAVVEHDKLQLESGKGYHVGSIHVHQSDRSAYTGNSISLGAAITRNTVTSVLGGQFAECTLNGLALGTDRQLVDNHTVIDHASPNCASHELYKSVLDGQAKGVFNGKIFVRKDAQKTDAKQTNKTLLLSDDATIDTKPQLEIFADDVKCTHGATVGQLDDQQVFYLRSRGVGIGEARDILTYAFASDIIGRVHVDPLREQLEGMLHSRLRQGRIRSHADQTE
jgi:Fe-S cluster assembly protein SufD